MLDARGFQFLGVDRAFHQARVPRTARRLKRAALGLVRDLFGDVQPGARRAVLDQVEGLMDGVVRGDEEICAGFGQLFGGGEHEFGDAAQSLASMHFMYCASSGCAWRFPDDRAGPAVCSLRAQMVR